MLYATPSQTVGPYLRIGFEWMYTETLVGEGVSGQRISVEGVFVDGRGAPINDAVIEIWQANSHGRYAHPEDTRDLPLEPGFRGFGRCATDEQGAFRFHSVKPGRVPYPDGRLQAPHIAVSVLARGVLKRMATRIYFADEISNSSDPILSQIPPERRDTLVAMPIPGRDGVYRFNIVAQGEVLGQKETVFFDF